MACRLRKSRPDRSVTIQVHAHLVGDLLNRSGSPGLVFPERVLGQDIERVIRLGVAKHAGPFLDLEEKHISYFDAQLLANRVRDQDRYDPLR